MTVGTNEVEKLKSNWSNNRVMSSGTAYLHISSLDTGHLAISHSDTAQNPNIKINTGSSIYSLMYQAKDVTKWYEPKIYDINGAEVQVEDIPIRDKIIISKLLISCVDNIFNTADQE
jgi:hypothetical protein